VQPPTIRRTASNFTTYTPPATTTGNETLSTDFSVTREGANLLAIPDRILKGARFRTP
jgi:hypothetical protein